jgi:hypothetical protein
MREVLGTEYYRVKLTEACCGTAAVSRYLGKSSHLIDNGPWGRLWTIVKNHKPGITELWPLMCSENTYELWVRQAIHRPPPRDPAEWALTFLALQREAFNGKPVECGGEWRHPGLGRRFSYNKWVKSVHDALRTKIRAVNQADINTVEIPPRELIYCDPDYEGTTGYGGRSVNLERFIAKNRKSFLFVSYDKEIPGDWTEVRVITHGRRTGYTRSARELLHIWHPDKGGTSAVSGNKVPESLVDPGASSV